MDLDDWENWYKSLKVGDEVMYCLFGNSWKRSRVIKVNKKSLKTTGDMIWRDGYHNLNKIHVIRLYPVDESMHFV